MRWYIFVRSVSDMQSLEWEYVTAVTSLEEAQFIIEQMNIRAEAKCVEITSKQEWRYHPQQGKRKNEYNPVGSFNGTLGSWPMVGADWSPPNRDSMFGSGFTEAGADDYDFEDDVD